LSGLASTTPWTPGSSSPSRRSPRATSLHQLGATLADQAQRRLLGQRFTRLYCASSTADQHASAAAADPPATYKYPGPTDVDGYKHADDHADADQHADEHADADQHTHADTDQHTHADADRHTHADQYISTDVYADAHMDSRPHGHACTPTDRPAWIQTYEETYETTATASFSYMDPAS
jgi:hypothetical protein